MPMRWDGATVTCSVLSCTATGPTKDRGDSGGTSGKGKGGVVQEQ